MDLESNERPSGRFDWLKAASPSSRRIAPPQSRSATCFSRATPSRSGPASEKRTPNKLLLLLWRAIEVSSVCFSDYPSWPALLSSPEEESEG